MQSYRITFTTDAKPKHKRACRLSAPDPRTAVAKAGRLNPGAKILNVAAESGTWSGGLTFEGLDESDWK